MPLTRHVCLGLVAVCSVPNKLKLDGAIGCHFCLIVFFLSLLQNASGIVRAIDTLKHVLYVITPVPKSSMQKVDLLLQGFIQIPTCLLQVIMRPFA